MPKEIQTPVVKYWEFKRNPFRDYALSGNLLNLFVCRKEEISDIIDSLDNPITGVFGSLGIGKTTFLNMIKYILEKEDEYKIIYADMGHCTQINIYRELLRILLENLQYKKYNTIKRSLKINTKKELELLDSKVTSSHSSKIGAKAGIETGISKSRGKEQLSHSEETARTLLRKIIQNISDNLVILIDDLEKIKYSTSSNPYTYLSTITGFTNTFKDCSNEKVSFVLTLDDHFATLIEAERNHGTGAISFSFGEFIELNNFSPSELKEFIEVRIRNSGWKNSFINFIKVDAFWLLIASTGGHPRKVLTTLREAIKYIHRKKRKKMIDIDAILFATRKIHYEIDDIDIKIINFLQKSPGVSPSDTKFQEHIGIVRSTLADRLKNLVPRVNLMIKKSSSISGKLEYSLPEISFK